MKKILLTLSLVMVVAAASARPFWWGVKGGVNLSNLNCDLDNKFSFHAGAFVEFELDNHWSIMPELLYSRQGAKGDIAGKNIKLKANYLTLPVIVKYMLTRRLSIEAGPQVGYLLNAKIDLPGANRSVTDKFKSLSMSLCAGLGYNICRNIGVQARYSYGLIDVNDKGFGDMYNRVMQVGAYIRF